MFDKLYDYVLYLETFQIINYFRTHMKYFSVESIFDTNFIMNGFNHFNK